MFSVSNSSRTTVVEVFVSYVRSSPLPIKIAKAERFLLIVENEINVYVMPLGSLERRLDSTETTGGLPNFPSLPVKIYFFVMCTHTLYT